jgi:hypothetical protein
MTPSDPLVGQMKFSILYIPIVLGLLLVVSCIPIPVPIGDWTQHDLSSLHLPFSKRMEGGSATNSTARQRPLTPQQKRRMHASRARTEMDKASWRMGTRRQKASAINGDVADVGRLVADHAKEVSRATNEAFGKHNKIHPISMDHTGIQFNPNIAARTELDRVDAGKRMLSHTALTVGSGVATAAITFGAAVAHTSNALAVPKTTIPPLTRAGMHKTLIGVSKGRECLGQACNQLLAKAKGSTSGKVDKGK